MELGNIHTVYFLGIGGIGMSALARWFNEQGKTVFGYDKTPTKLTDELIEEGAEVTFVDELGGLASSLPKDQTLIVYTPAMPKDSVLLNYFQSENYNVLKRSEVLGLITKAYFTIGVAGTHGKTSTSTLLAHILKASGKNVLAFLGGVSKNYDSNFLLNDPTGDQPIVVIEADEYDRTFLRLNPDMAIITSTDPDHLDIYKDDKVFIEGFEEYVKLLPEDGILISHKSVAPSVKAFGPTQSLDYAMDDCRISACNIRVKDGEQCFDLKTPNYQILDIVLPLSGYHNVLNCTAAVSVAALLGISGETIKKAVASFQGIKRRFEYIVRTPDHIYIDDYAHHPSEINAFVEGVRAAFPEKKMLVVFQPHLYSRTQDFMDDFAESLSKVDELILLDIYPARELPIEGITSDVLLEKVNLRNKRLLQKEEVVSAIKKSSADIVVTLGAGDIDLLIEPIKNELEKVNA